MPYFKMRHFRHRHGISLHELGAAIGVSHQYLSGIELMKESASPQAQALIFEAFEAVIAERLRQSDELTSDYARCKDHFFDQVPNESEETL